MGAAASTTLSGLGGTHLDAQLGDSRSAISKEHQALAAKGIIDAQAQIQTSATTAGLITAFDTGGRTANDYKKEEPPRNVIPFSQKRGDKKPPPPKAKAKKSDAAEKNPNKLGNKLSWREHVWKAKRRAALVLSAVECMQGGAFHLDPHAVFLSGIPFIILNGLGEEQGRFTAKANELHTYEVAQAKAESELAALMNPVTEEDLKVAHRGPLSKGVRRRQPIRMTKAAEARAARYRPRKLEPEAVMLEVSHEEKLEKARKAVAESKHAVMEQERDLAGDLKVYCNRVNALQVLGAKWELPFLYNVAKWADSDADDPKHYKNQVKEMLQQGKVCVHLTAVGPGVTVSNTEQIPVANVDPWEFVELYADENSSYRRGTRLRGMSMGARQLISLMTRVSEIAGPDAIKKLVVVITLSSAVVNSIGAELHERNFYGLNPENVIIVEQPWLPGFSWDPPAREFKPCCTMARPTGMRRIPLGTGYAMKLLTFKSEGYSIGKDGSKVPLRMSVMDWLLKEKKVTWMTLNRVADLNRYTKELVFDLDTLALSVKLQKEQGVNMTIDAYGGVTQAEMRRSGSVLLRNTNQAGKNAGRCVQHLEWACFNTPKAMDLLTDMMKGRPNDTACSSSRIAFYLPEIVKILNATNAAQIYTPIFKMDEDADGGATKFIRPIFDISDLASKCTCAALVGRGTPNIFSDVKDLGPLVVHMSKQERDEKFVELMNSLPPSKMGAVAMTTRAGGIHKTRLTVMVCCTSNETSAVAYEFVQHFVRRQIDRVILVHFVQSMQDMPYGKRILETFPQHDLFVDTRKEVIIRSTEIGSTLKDDIEAAADQYGANLVVLGTNTLGSDQNAKLGSVGYRYLASGINVTTMFVSEKMSAKARVKEPNFRLGVGLSTDCKPMLDFGVKLHRAEHDSMHLYRCARAGEVDEAAKVLAARKHYVQTSAQIGCKGAALDGHPSRLLPQTVTTDQLDILMLEVPEGIAVSPGLKKIFLKINECALVCFKDKPRRTSLFLPDESSPP